MYLNIISLVPSHTEILFALGLGEQVAGVTANCDYPPQALRKIKVGTFACPDSARILSLHPDLVIAGGGIHSKCVTELRQAGITVLNFMPQSVNNIFEIMKKIIEFAGAYEVGGSTVAMLKDKLLLIEEKAKQSACPKVIFVMGKQRLMTPGPASCQYDALRIAGASMISFGEDVSYAPITWDDIIDEDPDIILACGRSENEPLQKRCMGCTLENRPCMQNVEDILHHPFLEKVTAIKTRRVYTIPCHYLCRTGPRLFDGMMKLAQLFQA
ncbi:iron complex transport system substrate-binding protein [Desulfotomaculum arcticum]|uniref:Iron complex transport system substrate-binding protein n=1 Tax=Desulfotruncus arcticus DSM 17038 TaxID=1121424 RepID=A0A1I2VVA1_9FIRM|nr:helical backbone metal receptor [Desulfotruncus arcticus]SFG93040.1 iron complex transport system substrate-binding protein [Desulfotomaculum arcticum] [Desulfotruncus arcticus DSM 17038]